MKLSELIKSNIYLILFLLLNGCLYSNVKFPLDEDVWETKLGTKEGRASNHVVMWLVAWGDAGVKKAAENGGIKVVQHLDMAVESYAFGIYSRTSTIVYGD
jgi:hypothetical protein